MSIERCRGELTRAELAIERRDIWLTEAGETERALRLQLASAHEAIGCALALLRQDSAGAATIVLEDALKGSRR